MENRIVRKRRKIVRKRKPTCKCGCGGFVKIGNVYLLWHHTKDPNSFNKSGWHHSEESKQKLRIAHTGVPLSEAHKQKIKETIRKTYENPEIRAKCAHPQIISEKHKKAVKEFMLAAWKNPVFKEKLIGKNANNWKGGLSFEPYSTEFNNSLKKHIKERDNNKCQNPKCRNNTKIINIHHIDYNKLNCSELNLITLCTSCNSRANFKRHRWEKLYKRIINEKYNERTKRRRKIS
jgi:hypothetical protein